MSKRVVTRRTALTLESYGVNVSKIKREVKLQRDRDMRRSSKGHRSAVR